MKTERKGSKQRPMTVLPTCPGAEGRQYDAGRGETTNLPSRSPKGEFPGHQGWTLGRGMKDEWCQLWAESCCMQGTCTRHAAANRCGTADGLQWHGVLHPATTSGQHDGQGQWWQLSEAPQLLQAKALVLWRAGAERNAALHLRTSMDSSQS